MTFHVEFTYSSGEREKLLRFMGSEGVKGEGPLKFKGAWVAAQTGKGYAIIDTDDASALYDICCRWVDYGSVQLTPVISAGQV